MSFATAMTVFTLNIHHKGGRGRQIPAVVKRVFFDFFAKLLFIHLDVVKETGPSRKGMVCMVVPLVCGTASLVKW